MLIKNIIAQSGAKVKENGEIRQFLGRICGIYSKMGALGMYRSVCKGEKEGLSQDVRQPGGEIFRKNGSGGMHDLDLDLKGDLCGTVAVCLRVQGDDVGADRLKAA